MGVSFGLKTVLAVLWSVC